jgi:peptide/nickel transport system substrate-binding protein
MLAALAAALAGGAAVAAPDEKNCGTVVMPLMNDISSMSPLYGFTNGYNGDAVGLMYLTLLWIVDNSRIDWSRSLAQSITTTDDQTFTVTLRPWVWSDGVPVTSADVAYYFKLAKAMGPDWADYGLGGMPYKVKSFTVISPTQFQIVTTEKVNPTWFILNGIGNLTPLPEHAWRHTTLDQMFQAQSEPGFFRPVDGPVMVSQLDVGIDATFVPNPRWPGAKLHVSRFIFSFMNHSGESLLDLRAGTVDLARLPSEFYGRMKLPAHTHVVVLPQEPYQNMMSLNYRNPAMAAFADVRVRQAMEDAIDQAAIVKDVFHGIGDVAYAPVLESMPQFMSPAIKAGHFPVGYDPVKARALLAAAGYAPGKDGIMARDGRRLSFTFLLAAGSNTNTALYEAVQSELHAVGIEMKIRNISYNEMLDIEQNQPLDWDATGDGIAVNPYPSGESVFLAGSGGNEAGYNNATVNRLIERNLADPDPAYLYDYEDDISAQQPAIFLPRGRPIYLVNDRLHGLEAFYAGSAFAPDELYCTGGSP